MFEQTYSTHPRIRRSGSLAALVATLLLISSVEAGVTHTGHETLPLTPGPERCRVTPIDYAARSDSARGTPVATPLPLPSLEGSTVDADIALAIENVIIEVIACQNAGEPLRAYALYTDVYLGEVLIGLDGAILTRMATPHALDPGDWTTIVAIEDLRQLADGRVYATVTLDPSLIPVRKMFGFILVRQDNRWLIDDILDELEFSLP